MFPLPIKISFLVVPLIAVWLAFQAPNRWSRSTFTVQADWSKNFRVDSPMLKSSAVASSAKTMAAKTPVYLYVTLLDNVLRDPRHFFLAFDSLR